MPCTAHFIPRFATGHCGSQAVMWCLLPSGGAGPLVFPRRPAGHAGVAGHALHLRHAQHVLGQQLVPGVRKCRARNHRGLQVCLLSFIGCMSGSGRVKPDCRNSCIAPGASVIISLLRSGRMTSLKRIYLIEKMSGVACMANGDLCIKGERCLGWATNAALLLQEAV